MFKMLPRPLLWLALVALLLTGCVRKDERQAKGPLPRLDKLFPDKVMAGQGFNVQANGQSALGAFQRWICASTIIRSPRYP